MPNQIDLALRERAVRLVLEHRAEYPSIAKAIVAVAGRADEVKPPEAQEQLHRTQVVEARMVNSTSRDVLTDLSALLRDGGYEQFIDTLRVRWTPDMGRVPFTRDQGCCGSRLGALPSPLSTTARNRRPSSLAESMVSEMRTDPDSEPRWPVCVFEVDDFPVIVNGFDEVPDLYEEECWDEIALAFDRDHRLVTVSSDAEGRRYFCASGRSMPEMFAEHARSGLTRVWRIGRFRVSPANAAERELIESLNLSQLWLFLETRDGGKGLCHDD